MNPRQPKKPPRAPAVYRPSVLQAKRSAAMPQRLVNNLPAQRFIEPHGPKLSQLPISVGRPAVIQRAAAAPKPAASKSGRDPATLWRHFASYRPEMAKEVTAAFQKAGYTMANMGKEILKAIKTRGLDLPAHGSGAAGGAVQGNLDDVARNWVTVLTAWAAAYPAGGGGGGGGGGMRHTPAEEAAARQEKLDEKLAQSKSKKNEFCEENGHKYRSFGDYRVCTNCGHLEGDD